ncbi:hypothetical protein SJAG_01111 [Schizosaccharomyces japonicus yFS275]|uniref:SWI/SNF complex subunit Snf5 n=1 Tax=Schizosaccharomyces japonicus (strain yFS275 / FY16936) TaxID=402676 RepID=B6JZS1_SCHJY|nr:hypothetical protein SJAG_01111 [Schizosaccharomyces japonicus yFS275]EEB06071.1 hypothetical protein SJAG_01111 [Schizosaccharomyces japonicus yFS275]
MHNKKRQKYYPALTNGAIRVILKVDVTIGRVNYVDNVEWDISNSSNDAELFASITCDELGLSGDFKTAIAHSIREQAQLYLNSYLVLTELAEQQDEDELSSFVLPHLSHAIKKTTTSTPEVMFFSSEEAERMDRDYDRETRRVRRRYGRLKRGLNLPDINDIPKTHKLLLTSGTILTDEKIYDISDTLPIPGEITKDGDQRLIITLKVPSEKLRQLIGNTIAGSTSVGSTFGTQEILEKSMPAADKHEDVISITIRGNQQTFELEKPPNCVPSWLMPCLSQLKSRYPMDNYTLIIKTSDNPIDPLTIRLKCDHCENEIVSAGPANSLGNFELHLLSKKHRDLVDKKNFLM